MILGAVFVLALAVLAFIQALATKNTPAGNNDGIWLFVGVIALVGVILGFASTWLDDRRAKRSGKQS